MYVKRLKRLKDIPQLCTMPAFYTYGSSCRLMSQFCDNYLDMRACMRAQCTHAACLPRLFLFARPYQCQSSLKLMEHLLVASPTPSGASPFHYTSWTWGFLSFGMWWRGCGHGQLVSDPTMLSQLFCFGWCELQTNWWFWLFPQWRGSQHGEWGFFFKVFSHVFEPLLGGYNIAWGFSVGTVRWGQQSA